MSRVIVNQRPITKPPEKLSPPPRPGVAEMVYLMHGHHWKYDCLLPSGLALYHCDDHDPPVTRAVHPGGGEVPR